jgi:predicted MFS family arabinose efflux permease
VNTLGAWIYMVRIIHGLSEAAMFTAIFTYGADTVPASRRTEGLALFGVSGLLPIAFGGVIGDVIVARLGFGALFWAAVVFALSALVIAVALPEPSRTALLEPRCGFFRAIGQPSLLPLWWMAGTFSFVLTGYFTFLRTFVDKTGIGSVGSFFAFYAGTAIAVRLLFARLPARIGEKRVLLPALIALMVGFVVLARAGSAVDIAAAGILCGAGHGYAFPILFGLTVTRASEATRGSAVAFFTALFDIGVFVGAPLLGAVIARAGYPAMYALAAALLGIATVVYFAWDRRWDPESVPTAVPS